MSAKVKSNLLCVHSGQYSRPPATSRGSQRHPGQTRKRANARQGTAATSGGAGIL